MLYSIKNDAFIYEDNYIEENYYYNNDDYKIAPFSFLFENPLFIPTQNIDKNKNIVSIKSELNKDRKKAIIWWNFEGDNQTRYGNYNFNDWAIDIYSSKISNACTNSIYEERINVFPYKEQITFIVQ